MTALSSRCSNIVSVAPSCILTQKSDDGSFSVKPLPDVTQTELHSCCARCSREEACLLGVFLLFFFFFSINTLLRKQKQWGKFATPSRSDFDP